MKTKRVQTNIYPILLLATVILVLALVCGVCSAPVATAQGEPVQVSFEEVTVHRGQTFAMDVTVTQNTGLNAMKLVVDYDHSAMTLIGITRREGLSAMTMTTTNTETDKGYGARPFTLFFDSIAPTTETGVVVTLLFETNIKAPIGEYEVSVTYDSDNTRSNYREPVALGLKSGIVHLLAGEFSARYEDYDGTLLYEEDFNDGDVPAYVGSIPQRAEDDCYTYEFDRFQGAVSDNLKVLIYRALYKATPKVYTVIYYVDGMTTDPDQTFDEADYYGARQFAYGSDIDLTLSPFRQNYTFVGWFADEQFTIPLSTASMPSRDMRVYGYMRYNVRVIDIPKIRLTYEEVGEKEVRVDVYMRYNPGVNGLLLGLSYDRESIRLVNVTRGTALSDMEFDTAKLELNDPAFKFWWNNASNSTEVGLMMSLLFDIRSSENGIYPVTLTYNETSDATYHNVAGEVWYTRLDIVGTSIPVGEKYHWNEPVGETTIDVTSSDGKPLDVELLVKIADVEVAEESLDRLYEQDLEIKNKYSINLIRDGEVITSDTDLRIAIGLTKAELDSQHLSLYYLDSQGQLVPYDFTLEDNAAVFNMRNIEYWVLVGDAPVMPVVVDNSWTGETIRAVLLPSLLAVATMAYALLLLAQLNKNNREIRRLKGKGGK